MSAGIDARHGIYQTFHAHLQILQSVLIFNFMRTAQTDVFHIVILPVVFHFFFPPAESVIALQNAVELVALDRNGKVVVIGIVP